jgi:hypothetical protein
LWLWRSNGQKESSGGVYPTGFTQKELPFVAMLTMFAMLAGFLLIFLLPYSQAFGWLIFLVIEITICAIIVKKLLEARRRISAAKVS